tara:strand:- start:605 stop:748 length:144 start_codon:yes stop_codon:yes gene_type:complete
MEDFNELKELSHASIVISNPNFSFSQIVIFNFNLKTYQAYTNLPMLA